MLNQLCYQLAAALVAGEPLSRDLTPSLKGFVSGTICLR